MVMGNKNITFDSISDVALYKKNEYDTLYNNWRIENPGQIMHGATIKSTAAELASHCHTMIELRSLVAIYKRKADSVRDTSYTVHGFNFYHDALKEILDICNIYFD